MVWNTRRATDRGAPLPPAPLAVLAIAGLVLLLATLGTPRPAVAQEAVLSRTVPTASGDITVSITYIEGDEAWAERIVTLSGQAIPVLEEFTGVPYPGQDEVEIHEKESREIFGYAGLAGCYRVTCGISVVPGDGDDATLFHELAHIWTQAFRDRWLSEGTAEYLSWKVLARLSPGAVSRGDDEWPGWDGPSFALETWGAPQATRSIDDEFADYQGYYWSPTFFRRLEEQLGPEIIRNTYAAVIVRGGNTVDSKKYMDALEDAGGGNNDEMFLDFIFTEKARPLLAKRRGSRERLAALTTRAQAEAPELSADALKPAQDAVAGWEFQKAGATLDKLESGLDAYLTIRDDLAALRTATEEAGLAYPLPLESALATWNFPPYLASIPNAHGAIDAYRSAATAVSAPRSLWQRMGLIGKSPDAQLRQAAGAFAQTEFKDSIKRSHAAQTTMADAGGDALLNVLIAAAVLTALATFTAVLWSWSQRDDPAPPAHGATDDAGSELATPNP